MPSQAELQGMLGRSLSRRDVLKLGVVGAGALFGHSRQEALAQQLDPLKNPDAKDGISFADPAIQRTWAKTDLPVIDGHIARTWMWGPSPFTVGMKEQYTEAPGGQRLVQYFDKSRMEITYPDGDPNSIWYVTNGLLATELISGRMQLGDSTFVEAGAAEVNVAGDPDDLNGPTYASFASHLDDEPQAPGTVINQQILRNGAVGTNPVFNERNVTVAYIDEVTNHGVATPFAKFMFSTGIIYEDGQYVEGRLFEDPNFATGRPITEAYWAFVNVGGINRAVLIQCFERRCLTYDYHNDPAWQVEAGNVGRHYYEWRYGTIPPSSSGIALLPNQNRSLE